MHWRYDEGTAQHARNSKAGADAQQLVVDQRKVALRSNHTTGKWQAARTVRCRPPCNHLTALVQPGHTRKTSKK